MNRTEGEYKSDRKMCNDIIWHQCQRFFFQGSQKRSKGQEKQRAKSLREPINYERNDQKGVAESPPISPGKKPYKKAHNTQIFLFFLLLFLVFTFSFLCSYFDVLLQFVRPANAFDTGNYLHAVRGSNKLINAYMKSKKKTLEQTLSKIDCGTKLNTRFDYSRVILLYLRFYGSFASGSCRGCCWQFGNKQFGQGTTCGQKERPLNVWVGTGCLVVMRYAAMTGRL